MPRLRLSGLALPLACALAAAGCVATPPAPPSPPSGSAVRKLGDSFRTHRGDVYMMRAQDEYHLIRCTTAGAIAGCYEDVFTMPRDSLTDDPSAKQGVRWNQWIPVPQIPGLDIMFLSPEWIALREQIAAAPLK